MSVFSKLNFTSPMFLVLTLTVSTLSAQENGPAASKSSSNDQSSVVNALDFGANGSDDVDDTQALQDALNEAADRGTLFIPAGNYLVSNTLLIDRKNALIIKGQGSSAIRKNYKRLPTSATSLTWNGPAGGVLLESRGCTATVIRDLTLNGSEPGADKSDRAGILFHVTRPKGYGDMINHLSNMSFFNADVGIQMGTKSSDHNCSDYSFTFITFRACGTGMKVKNDQGVDFLFNYIFALGTDWVFDFQGGGNLQVNTAQLTNSNYLKIGGGGRNVGTYLSSNVRIEASDGGRKRRYQLLSSYPHWKMADVKFISYADCQWAWHKNQTDARDLPLMDIGPGTVVTMENSIINSLPAALHGKKTAPAYLVGRENIFSYVKPQEDVSANEYGYFKLLNNLSGSLNTLPDVVKWPEVEEKVISANSIHPSRP